MTRLGGALPVLCRTRTLTTGALNRQQPRFMPRVGRVDLWASFGLWPSKCRFRSGLYIPQPPRSGTRRAESRRWRGLWWGR